MPLSTIKDRLTKVFIVEERRTLYKKRKTQITNQVVGIQETKLEIDPSKMLIIFNSISFMFSFIRAKLNKLVYIEKIRFKQLVLFALVFG